MERPTLDGAGGFRAGVAGATGLLACEGAQTMEPKTQNAVLLDIPRSTFAFSTHSVQGSFSLGWRIGNGHAPRCATLSGRGDQFLDPILTNPQQKKDGHAQFPPKEGVQ